MDHIRSWYAASANPAPLRAPLQGELTADVCVVGGGIAGCSTALHLAERGYRVVLLEWNDRYRDTMRAWWRGDAGLVGSFAERFAGSSDLFRHHGRKPTASINYVASHDGFTLYDTVSYNLRHNEANQEGNVDGHGENLSWNCGAEGPTSDPDLLALRARQIRNFLATLFLSQGVPMMLAGDEMGHSQRGNNNAYCQDNETTWLDWRLLECCPGTIRFVRRLTDLRRSRLWLRRDTFLKGTQRQAGSRDIAWLHPSGREMAERDWNDASLRCLALHMTGATDARLGPGGDVLAVFNADSGPVDLVLPEPLHGQAWLMVLDTERPDGDAEPRVVQCKEILRLAPRSTILLESQPLAVVA